MPIWISFLSGLVLFFFPNRVKYIKEILSLVVLLFVFALGIKSVIDVYSAGPLVSVISFFGVNIAFVNSMFSSLVLLAGIFFVLLISVYSIRINPSEVELRRTNYFYAFLHWTLSASAIVVLTDNLIVLLVLWGLLAVFLYLMIGMGKPGSESSGFKALVMVGGSDVLMLIGAALIFYLSGTVSISQMSIPLNSGLSIVAFILLLIGALTKAGAVPFHTWLIDASTTAPVSVMALFPGVLDKLLGMYLLARIGLDVFVMLPNSAMSIVLMSIGTLTILVAGGMALMQKNFMRLLAYSSVSQVGYLVLGIGSAVPLGIIGAFFHMFNNTIYKTSLFFTAGAVQTRTGETDFRKLGGLAKFMPITFITTFISALAISGIPPLNGFFSKLLIYQGILTPLATRYGQNWYFVIFIIAAMFGSVLTLAYFLKALHALFFAQPSMVMPKTSRSEAPWTMWLPMLILSILSIGLGIFAKYPLQLISRFKFNFSIYTWSALPVFGFSLAVILIVVGIVIGLIIYLLQRTQPVKTSSAFIGGEEIKTDQSGTVTSQEATNTGEDFYDSIKEVKVIGEGLRVADKKTFDLFEQGKKAISVLVATGKKIHNGLLHNYLGWLFLGVIAIIVIFFLLLLK